jgi:hypothetical protein
MAAICIVAVLAVAGFPHRAQPSSPTANSLQGGDFQAAQPGDGDFCPGQTSFPTLDLLVAASPATMWMPDARAASPSDLEATAICSGAPTLVFKSGVSVAFEPGWQLEDPKQRWTDMATQWGGEVQTILGQPAYVFGLGDKSDDPSVEPVPGATPTSEVLIVLDETLVRILGPEVPSSDLVDVAASLQPESPIHAGKS